MGFRVHHCLDVQHSGLRLLEGTGSSRFGKGLLWVITGTLTLANASNLYALVAPNEKSTLFLVLDAFWPLSNLTMLIVVLRLQSPKDYPAGAVTCHSWWAFGCPLPWWSKHS